MRPGAYPIAWITAAELAVRNFESGRTGSEEKWVSIDWGRSAHAALSRMKRLWAFRDGLKLYPQDYPGISMIFPKGLDFGFRKRERFGVFDLQISVRESRKPLGMLIAMAERDWKGVEGQGGSEGEQE